MGYDVHITRKTEWFEDEPEITLGEWLALVETDEEMRLDGFAEAALPEGGVLRTESDGLSVWTGYSGHEVGGNMAWFSYASGNVYVKNPDNEILRKMWSIAQSLGAKVQGDEGETYDGRGEVESAELAAAQAEEQRAPITFPVGGSPRRPWWKFW